MEIRTLRYFLAVAREQNMTSAANVLHVTQPTLSRQIADLERELGCTLFERTNRSTVLTADGMRLRQRADEILGLVDQTEQELSAGRGEVAGVVRIGAGETQAMRTVAQTFAELRQEHPRITCELFTGNADTVEERLERGLLDFALLLEPVVTDKYEWLRLPIRDRAGVAVAADGPWGHLDSVTPRDIIEMPLLVSSRTSHRSFDLGEWSGGVVRPEDLNVVGRFDLIGNAALLVEMGAACALGIDHLLQLEDDRLRFVPLEPALTIGSVMVWKKYHIFSQACTAFLDKLREACETEGR